MLPANELFDKVLIYGVLGLVLIGLPTAVIGGILFYRHQHAWTQRAFLRIYSDLDIHDDPQPGDVRIHYATFHGFLVFTTRSPHDAILPEADARKLLRRLLWFNLTWGLFAYLSFFMVPLAILEYFVQLRSFPAQALGETLPWEATEQDNPYASPRLLAMADVPTAERAPSRPSSFSLVLGVVCFGLGTIFGLSAIACVFMAKFAAAIGNVLLAALLLSTAHHYLRRER